ncbi:MAG: CCA tRNA nucleotidyltransferase [Actinomycetota bacterium]|nr:CCA tRNA nucleotidyltransferase [Actinomycetota bacterium]
MELVSAEARTNIEAQIGGLAEAFVVAGFHFYLVGGVVRDLALGRVLSGDIDVTTDARPGQIRQIIDGWADAIWDQGARFGTIGARRGDAMVEVTTHRAERYAPDSRKPEVDFSTVVDDDLSRRDFTVNAMAIELPRWELIDPFDGRGDLAASVLRTPINPASSFTDDPLRMLRAARFCAGYELEPVGELEDAMRDYASRLDIVSRERISDELRKFFALDTPGDGLDLLHRTGLLEHIAPVLSSPGSSVEINGAMLDRLGPDVAARWALLLWSARVEKSAARQTLSALRESSAFQREVLAVLRAAVSLDGARPSGDPEVRRLVVAAGSELDRGHAVLRAAGAAVPDVVWERVQDIISREGVASLRAPLNGDQVLQVLGRGGPIVGRALDHLLQCRLDEGPMDEATASERLRTWWAQQPRTDVDTGSTDN